MREPTSATVFGFDFRTEPGELGRTQGSAPSTLTGGAPVDRSRSAVWRARRVRSIAGRRFVASTDTWPREGLGIPPARGVG